MRCAFRLLFVAALLLGCDRSASGDDAPSTSHPKSAIASASPAPSAPVPAFQPQKVDVTATAMGTQLRFISYTTAELDEAKIRQAVDGAVNEIRRLEQLMSSWTTTSEIAAINAEPGKWVNIHDDTLAVLKKSLWISKLSHGAFDVSFNVMRNVWRFGDARQEHPTLPDPKLIKELQSHIDFRKIDLDVDNKRVRIAPGMQISVGGIAKGYAVDRAAAVLKGHGVTDFLAQAGGDLYGAGKKPNGDLWQAGIRDPRGPANQFFATLPLQDHAFSTAGDYARSFILDGKRYHHIIDPRTGYPADASRSVTIWAEDAFTADAIDDAVFILGPKKGLELVESLPGVGAVIVDKDNHVWVSERLKGLVTQERAPTDGI